MGSLRQLARLLEQVARDQSTGGAAGRGRPTLAPDGRAAEGGCRD
jgi:hypothetical protein